MSQWDSVEVLSHKKCLSLKEKHIYAVKAWKCERVLYKQGNDMYMIDWF